MDEDSGLQRFLEAAVELQTLVVEQTSAPEDSTQGPAQKLIDFQNKLLAEEAACTQAAALAESTRATHAMACEAARVAYQKASETRALVASLGVPISATRREETRAKRLLRLAKIGAAGAELLMKAQADSVATSKQVQAQNESLRLCEAEMQRLCRREDALVSDNARLRRETSTISQLQGEIDALSEDSYDMKAELSLKAAQLQVKACQLQEKSCQLQDKTAKNEKQLSSINKAKKGKMDLHLHNQRNIELLRLEKNVAVLALGQELKKSHPSMEELQFLVQEFANEGLIRDALEERPELKTEVERKARVFAETTKMMENDGVIKAGTKQGIGGMDSMGPKSLLSSGSNLSPASTRSGLMPPPLAKRARPA